MVVGNIAPDKNSAFEDWWIHPDLINPEILKIMSTSLDDIKKVDNYMLVK